MKKEIKYPIRDFVVYTLLVLIMFVGFISVIIISPFVILCSSFYYFFYREGLSEEEAEMSYLELFRSLLSIIYLDIGNILIKEKECQKENT